MHIENHISGSEKCSELQTKSRKRRKDRAHLKALSLVPVVGLEPTRGISPTDFESVTSTIPSHRLLKNAAEESAATLELDARFELATS